MSWEKPKRIGKVGVVWATEYRNGWTVYSREGIVAVNVSKYKATKIIREYKAPEEEVVNDG